MGPTITRHDLSSALIQILEARGVASPEDAVEVLGSPDDGVRLFVLVPSKRARAALADDLMKVTGRRHPTAGDIWILDDTQSVALIKLARRMDLRVQPQP